MPASLLPPPISSSSKGRGGGIDVPLKSCVQQALVHRTLYLCPRNPLRVKGPLSNVKMTGRLVKPPGGSSRFPRFRSGQFALGVGAIFPDIRPQWACCHIRTRFTRPPWKGTDGWATGAPPPSAAFGRQRTVPPHPQSNLGSTPRVPTWSVGGVDLLQGISAGVPPATVVGETCVI